MFEGNDEAFLIRQIAQNNCVLMLGAGFAWGIKNRFDRTLPLGAELSEQLWNYAGYDDNPSPGMSLAKTFQLALRCGRPLAELQSFLEDRLLVSHIPEEYDSIASVYWFRIYTTNIDDSLQSIFKRVGRQRLEVTAYPSAIVTERDQFLDRVQCIYLHGKLPCAPDQLTFSLKQYAKQSAVFDRLYDVFVGDYATRPTIFLGTELDEQVFFQYLEAREGRGETAKETRPKSFLIAPNISRATRDLLADFNIIAVSGTTDEFLAWLNGIASQLPSRDQLLESKIPTLTVVRERVRAEVSTKALKEFSASFHIVPLQVPQSKDKSKYLLGSSPRWEDIHLGLDVARDITQKLVADCEETLSEGADIRVLALLGTAGCGKSTILRRLGLTLAQRGHNCYLSNCEDMPRIEDVSSVVGAMSTRAVLLFDNAEGALGYIAKLAKSVSNQARPPLIIVASRGNDFYRKFSHFKFEGDVREVHVPNLARKEIVGLLQILEANGLLGKLRSMSFDMRIREFEVRSQKQILVAMREATEGRGFDEILLDEYKALDAGEARTLYLCVALCTASGYRLEKAEYVRCAQVEPAVALEILERQLLGMVLRTGAAENLLLLRHRRIAEYFATQGASRLDLLEAYKRLLPVLIPTADEIVGQSRRFRLYRELISHQVLFERFSSQPSLPRDLYDYVQPMVGGDVHFFLQYGCYEMQRGEYDFATNYLHQARGLEPGNRYVINAQGQLLLKRAVAAYSREEADSLRLDGKDLLAGNNDVWGHYDAHYYSILAVQEFQWIKKWCTENDERARELEHALDFVRRGLREFPKSIELNDVQDAAKEEYLRCALPR